MIRIEFGKNGKTLDDLAEIHWQSLNPVNRDNTLHKSALKRIVEDKVVEYKTVKNIERAEFYNKLKANDFELLERIIKCKVENFPNLINELTRVLTLLGLLDFKISKEGNFGHELVAEVFKYPSWRSGNLAKGLFEKMILSVCPYCNHNLIYYDTTAKLLVLQFDHFYDKGKFPYLCMSFFNLIPTCAQCNSPYKLTKDFSIGTHIHPYLHDYDSIASFSSDYTFSNTNYKIGVKYLGSDSSKAEKFNEDLSIMSRYNLDEIKKYGKLIYDVAQDYPKEVKEELMLKLGKDKDEIESKICIDKDIPYKKVEIHKKSLGKLKRDLAIQYGVITNRT